MFPCLMSNVNNTGLETNIQNSLPTINFGSVSLLFVSVNSSSKSAKFSVLFSVKCILILKYAIYHILHQNNDKIF